MIIVRIKAGFIKQANQVNIRRIIQLARAHFAHRQRDHTARVGNIIRAHSRQLPAAYFRRNQCLDRHIHRQIAKIRQRLCDFAQPPNTAQISQTCDQRNPALGSTQRQWKIIQRDIGQTDKQLVHRRLWIIQRGQQPSPLFLHQAR